MLAAALYNMHQDVSRLTFAQTLMQKIMDNNNWYTANNSLNQVSVFGGYAIVDQLCEMYLLDHDIKWYNYAKDIFYLLLASGRDRAGYFANTTLASGKWNIVHTGQDSDSNITLISQAAAGSNHIGVYLHRSAQKLTPSSIHANHRARDLTPLLAGQSKTVSTSSTSC